MTDATSCFINEQQMETVMQTKIIESVIATRFDMTYLNVFRCLAKYHNLDQQQISHHCVIPLQDTCIILSRLLKDGLIHSQEIPKLADYSKSIMLYAFRPERTRREVVNYVYKTFANLLNRKQFEIKKNERLIERVSIQ